MGLYWGYIRVILGFYRGYRLQHLGVGLGGWGLGVHKRMSSCLIVL